jgi:hypothetical protein
MSLELTNYDGHHHSVSCTGVVGPQGVSPPQYSTATLSFDENIIQTRTAGFLPSGFNGASMTNFDLDIVPITCLLPSAWRSRKEIPDDDGQENPVPGSSWPVIDLGGVLCTQMANSGRLNHQEPHYEYQDACSSHSSHRRDLGYGTARAGTHHFQAHDDRPLDGLPAFDSHHRYGGASACHRLPQ